MLNVNAMPFISLVCQKIETVTIPRYISL